ncbi:uncharacterized protein KY384_003506 [Bacidia gigantensis]|uniref:uncharacterized protein n=1 Tax=Bacidia gigantensis TaxID=2732470 RepID=UPI001D03DDF6|nr:uncharacterized protein KY384_003506 [Bacidia gigantensis]KAG8531870.1 hypothetical protein KY384_003506 [Bacidia gigantensis]
MGVFKSSKDYQYETLKGIKLVRVLDLHPSLEKSNQIKCDLRHVRVDSDVDFEALSYTWGDGKPTSEIQCNGARLFIRPSLEIALRHLRKTDDVRTMWIDAICINQSNTREREQQVPLMADVYSKASQVVAWIGEVKLSDVQALDIERLQFEVIDPDHKEVTWKLENYITALLKTMMAAVTLMRRPWFSRTWIIQEVALSRKLIIQCSDRIIRWSNFLALLDLIPLITDKEGMQVYFGEVFLERAHFVASVRSKIAERIAEHERQETDVVIRHVSSHQYDVWEDLQLLVSQARAFGATEESDRIFALLGLVDQKLRKGIPVDYGTPFQAMYKDFARHLIATTGSLSMLSQVGPEQDDKLESWVANWARELPVEPLGANKDGYYSATGASKPEIIPHKDAKVLALSGIFLDEIDQVKLGPSSDGMEALNRAQRTIARGTQFGLAESTPLLPYKSIADLLSKEPERVSGPGGGQASEYQISRKPVDPGTDPLTEKLIEEFSSLSMTSTRSSQGTSVTSESQSPTQSKSETIADVLARGIFTGLPRNPRVRQYHHIWGAIHPVNGVYMSSRSEAAWNEILPKDKAYPTGETVEEAYWRTLIGDKRTTLDLRISQPPNFWQTGFHIWQAELLKKQGHVSRVANEAGSRVLSRNRSDGSLALERRDSMLNQELRDYVQAENAKKEVNNRLQQLKVPAFRNIISTLIKVHNKSRPDSEIAPGYSNTELIGYLDGYDSLTEDQVARLRRSLSTIPPARLTDTELRNQIDKAFWYDFVRVARNRRFCVTKQGYIGWVPSSAKEGDRICLLLGGQVPYVVRPHKKRKGEWQFLGEAYVHGIMRGEAMQREGLNVETILLR